jgi:hypothetical protein
MNQDKTAIERGHLAAISESRSDEFYKWVGHSITAWAKVETWLFQLCWRSIGSSEASKERAAIVYFRTPALEARINLVDELVKTVLPRPERKDGGHPHPDVKEWNKLKQKSEKNLSTRRRIAHHPASPRKEIVEIRPASSPPKEPSPGTVHLRVAHAIAEFSRLEIYMSEDERLRGKGETLEPLYTGAIRSHCITVTGLADELMHFFQKVFLKHIKNAKPA